MTATHWIQLNLATRDDADAVFDVLDRLDPVLRGLRDARLVDRFFFMRKSPGMRVRFRAPSTRVRARLERAVRAFAAELRRDGVVTRAYFTCYEPETFMFGGADAIELVHEHFDTDAREYLRSERLRRAGRARLSAPLLSAAMLNDLFSAVAQVAEEVWDVWCNVAMLQVHPAEQPAAMAALRGADKPLPVVGLATFAPIVPRAEAAVLASYARTNARFARGLARLNAAGKLRTKRRLILPFVAQFHLNRFGHGPEARRMIYGPMIHALDPARQFAGFTPHAVALETPQPVASAR